MNTDQNIVLVDAGNTAIKMALVVSGAVKDCIRINRSQNDSIQQWIKDHYANSIVLASVLKAEETELFNRLNVRVDVFDIRSNIFFPIQYGTPETLGTDRICNAAYAFANTETKYAVVMDIGTCLKFDIIDRDQGYLGGSISPGIDLRYRALNSFTSKLPLIDNKSADELVGNSTENSMRSGVINGLQEEINGIMQRYRDKYGNLTFFVTGGDFKHFDIRLKNNIFADEFLTLKGLYEIYKHQA